MTKRAVAVAFALLAAGCAGPPVLNDAQEVVAALRLADTGGLEIAGAAVPAGNGADLSVTVNRDCSVAILRVLANGETAIVFPNRSRPDARLAGGTPLNIALRDEPGGRELFEFIAAAKADSWLFTKRPQAGADYVRLGTTTREIVRNIRLSLKGGAAAHQTIRVGG